MDRNLFYICAVVVLAAVHTSVVGAWDYVDEAAWASEFPMCNGNMQSPVSLDPLKSKAVRSSHIVLSKGCDFLASQNFTITDFNYTFGVIFDANVSCTISISKSVPVRLHRVIFYMGSEHAIDGSYTGMESQWEFVRNDSSLLIMSIMLGANYVDIPSVGPAIFAETMMQNLNSPTFSLPVNANFSSWITTKAFFTYRGSISLPPCTEGVDWVVVRDPVHIPRIVHLRFANAMRQRTPNFDDIGGNARPLQPLNGREVVYHITSSEVDLVVIAATKSSNAHIVIIVMVVAVACAIIWLWSSGKIDAAIAKKRAVELAQKEGISIRT